MKRNYKSDFDFFLRLKDCEGNVVPFPDYDWLARFYTDDNKANVYVASCIGGECKNCFNDGGQIHVVCNAHRLSAGKLKVEFHAQLPDDIYPDGRQLVVTPAPLDIELVRGAGDCPHEDISAELRQPVMTIGTVRQTPPPAFTAPVKRRNIPIGAVPGFVYRWRYKIRITSTVLLAQGPESYDLNGMYVGSFNDPDKQPEPLAAQIRGVTDDCGNSYAYDVTDGILTVQPRDDMNPYHPGGVYINLGDMSSTHIAVQRDGLGRKVFTELETYSEEDVTLARPVIDAGWVGRFMEGDRFNRLRGYDTQIWWRSGKGRYKWHGHRDKKATSRTQRQYFIRVRKTNRNSQKSEWVYLCLYFAANIWYYKNVWI